MAKSKKISSSSNKIFFLIILIVFLGVFIWTTGKVHSNWKTYTDSEYKYSISYPSNSKIYPQGRGGFQISNGGFIYVSVIPREKRYTARSGDIYNYIPAETQILLDMEIGESKSTVPEYPHVNEFYTYRRLLDIQIGGFTAKAYFNPPPVWEAPEGVGEYRYYVDKEDYLYLIGGYVDTGLIIEEKKFKEIIFTIRFTN